MLQSDHSLMVLLKPLASRCSGMQCVVYPRPAQGVGCTINTAGVGTCTQGCVYTGLCMLYTGLCMLYTGVCMLYTGVCMLYTGLCMLYTGLCLHRELPVLCWSPAQV